ncbi:hypothetical protein F5876DRAFT_69889 [Lentinula aff. lateritia]|uniref:Uncharacterized protein n=1 Tax=Lentinula aff. lateritia TaxID=2804960 RepID=A0ACC1TKQ9_9AGAR|nr:hypothetical protein F5876DRAFT_69889 [Lentinula aff. lateritia]
MIIYGKRTHIFPAVGSFVAKAMLESRRRGSVDYRDAQACRLRLGQFCTKLLSIAAASSHLNDELALFKENITVQAPALHFTLPGHGIELKLVLKAILGSGSTLQAKAFRERFRNIIPIGDRQAFTVEELVMLFGNGDERLNCGE